MDESNLNQTTRANSASMRKEELNMVSKYVRDLVENEVIKAKGEIKQYADQYIRIRGNGSAWDRETIAAKPQTIQSRTERIQELIDIITTFHQVNMPDQVQLFAKKLQKEFSDEVQDVRTFDIRQQQQIFGTSPIKGIIDMQLHVTQLEKEDQRLTKRNQELRSDLANVRYERDIAVQSHLEATKKNAVMREGLTDIRDGYKGYRSNQVMDPKEIARSVLDMVDGVCINDA